MKFILNFFKLDAAYVLKRTIYTKLWSYINILMLDILKIYDYLWDFSAIIVDIYLFL